MLLGRDREIMTDRLDAHTSCWQNMFVIVGNLESPTFRGLYDGSRHFLLTKSSETQLLRERITSLD